MNSVKTRTSLSANGFHSEISRHLDQWTSMPNDREASFSSVRQRTIAICSPLCIEDYVVQPSVEVSPPKWHLAHTTWFFEEAILSRFEENYKPYHPTYLKLFNSYYKSAGEHWLQSERGQLSRPTVEEVLAYREAIDERVMQLLNGVQNPELDRILELGLHHEQQHQELLFMRSKTEHHGFTRG